MRLLRSTFLWIVFFPYALGCAGAFLNQLVLVANHDTFPVRINLAKAKVWAPNPKTLPDGTVMMDDIHCIMTDKTRLNLLADNFDQHNRIMTVGDFFIEWSVQLWEYAIPIWIALAVIELYKRRDETIV